LDGATGPQGPIGLTGAMGPQGPAGNDGLDGATGPQGPIGLTGATGATGPQGPTGLLSSGTTAGNTPYWNGTNWVTNSSAIHNNGGNIGIGTTNPTTAKLVISGAPGSSGLDLSSTDQYAHMRVINNSNGPSDKDMYIGYGSGTVSATHMYANNAELMTLAGSTVQVAGQIKITGGSPGAGKVLASDAVGLATWTTMPSGPAGPTGPQGPTGLTGATGATGATGPAGLLPNGTAAGNTPYWNGTTWVTNSSNIFNNGGNVGIGNTNPFAPLQFANTIANRKVVLYQTTNNDHDYFGFGINAGMLRYQVDATTSAHAFFARTSATTSNELMRILGNGNVGIGTSAPTDKLHILGTSGNTLRIEDGNEAAGKVLTSDATGNASWQSPGFNCAFHATLGANQASTGAQDLVVFNTELFDLGGNYNPATGKFTAPTTGVYQFNVGSYKSEPANSRHAIQVYKNAAYYLTMEYWYNGANNNNNVRNGSVLLQLNAGDTIEIWFQQTVASTFIGGANPNAFFSGFRVQ
jgi:hypothetical protein